MSQFFLVIDQGTSSSRAMLFTPAGEVVGTAQREINQHFPHAGWVEHRGEELWTSSLEMCRQVLQESGINASAIRAIGITNQRETTLVWDKSTGQPVTNAIVWQDRRTTAYCEKLIADGWAERIQQTTGLLVDPYFSATKLHWILNNVPGVRARADAGNLLFGTVDSWLVWQLTGGKEHVTDATNASRTMLFNIHSQQWDDDLLKLFEIPHNMLPRVLDSAAHFGTTDPVHLGRPIAITAVAGDQQAALFGQACFTPGMCKSTYGTGCFMMINTGATAVLSHNRLLTTIGYRLNGKLTYALEGSIFMAGATIQWLRDGLRMIGHAGESLAMAESAGAHHAVYLVPAFTGLGAPHWDPRARGAIVGLTRDTGIEEIVTAGLQSVAYQSRDLLEAMQADGIGKLHSLRVDGGMVVNDWMVQFLADILRVDVERPKITETTALGAAMLAAYQVGEYRSLDEIQELWQCEEHFTAKMDRQLSNNLYRGWESAVHGIKQISSEISH